MRRSECSTDSIARWRTGSSRSKRGRGARSPFGLSSRQRWTFSEASRAAVALTTSDATDTFGRLSSRIAEYAAAASGCRTIAAPLPESETLASPTTREIRYWALAAHLASGDAKRTLDAVRVTLADPHAAVSAEFEWRAAAIGAAAAKTAAPGVASQMATRAQKALDRLRAEWKGDAAVYLARPDLKALQRRAGLTGRS